jgi:hydroxypyruvate reductase
MSLTDTAAMRDALLAIAEKAVSSVRPGPALQRAVRREGDRLTVDGVNYDLSRFRRVLLLGAGKASASMALALEDILGDRLDFGLVVTKYGHGLDLRRTEVLEAGHPVPDEAGVAAADRLLELARSATERDLVLCAISGGASALVPAPVPPLTLAHKQETTRRLLGCGAPIEDVNAIRKHLSRFKGGGLAGALAPATVATLIISDVVGDGLDVIASGPTAPDRSTFADCLAVLDKYGLCSPAPDSVQRVLAGGAAGDLPETRKPGDPCFKHVQNVIVAGNAMALDGAARAARQRGYAPVIVDSAMQGEARDVARDLVRRAGEHCAGHCDPAPPICLLSGGETTVTIHGTGKGGRNQEFALAAGLEMAAMGEHGRRMAVLSLGTDGTDGPTDAAGAWVLPGTLAPDLMPDARAALENNDAYEFFTRTGTLLKTGPTRTNVMDVAAVLVAPDKPS